MGRGGRGGGGGGRERGEGEGGGEGGGGRGGGGGGEGGGGGGERGGEREKGGQGGPNEPAPRVIHHQPDGGLSAQVDRNGRVRIQRVWLRGVQGREVESGWHGNLRGISHGLRCTAARQGRERCAPGVVHTHRQRRHDRDLEDRAIRIGIDDLASVERIEGVARSIEIKERGYLLLGLEGPRCQSSIGKELEKYVGIERRVAWIRDRIPGRESKVGPEECGPVREIPAAQQCRRGWIGNYAIAVRELHDHRFRRHPIQGMPPQE